MRNVVHTQVCAHVPHAPHLKLVVLGHEARAPPPHIERGRYVCGVWEIVGGDLSGWGGIVGEVGGGGKCVEGECGGL